MVVALLVANTSSAYAAKSEVRCNEVQPSAPKHESQIQGKWNAAPSEPIQGKISCIGPAANTTQQAGNVTSGNMTAASKNTNSSGKIAINVK